MIYSLTLKRVARSHRFCGCLDDPPQMIAFTEHHRPLTSIPMTPICDLLLDSGKTVSRLQNFEWIMLA